MSIFKGGMADGVSLSLRRAPIMLRVTKDKAGNFDALDQVEDVARPGETIALYRLATAPTRGFLCCRSRGKKNSGYFESGEYELIDNQPADEILRDNQRYAEWCDANQLDLLPAWYKVNGQ
jgi:hypothetical protein